MNQTTVLVTEGDDEIREFLCDAVLRPIGYRVLMASDGREGLIRALNDNPDLILLNLVLPRLSGLSLLSQLRLNQCRIPAIVLTACGAEQAILRAFRLGARDYLQRPFSVNEAQTVIENVLMAEYLRQEKENLARELAQTNQQLQRQVHNWIALNDIAQAITSTLEEPQIFRRVMENVNRILQVEMGSLLLLDQETGQLEFQVTLREEVARYSAFRRKPGEGIAGWVAQHGEPLLIPDVCEAHRFHAQLDQVTGFPHLSILCVPLKAKEQVIGVIEVTNKQDGPESRPFTKEDLDLLTTLASWVAVAVENARLNRTTRKIAATTALRQTVATVAHHINNRLMAFSLELDSLDEDRATECTTEQEFIDAVHTSAHRCIQEISAVVRALDRLVEIRTQHYVGKAEMIDIEDALAEQLRKAKVPHPLTQDHQPTCITGQGLPTGQS